MKKRNLKSKLLAPLILTISTSLLPLVYNGNCVSYATGGEVPLPKYMILMDDQFEGNQKLNQLIDWKKRKGNDVVVVKTSQVPSQVQGAPTNIEIVSYLRGLSDNDYPTYLLIVGDETEQNGVAGKRAQYILGSYTYSDINIRSRNDDDTPDVYSGRLPASNENELVLMLDKVLMMDRTPPQTDMYDKVVVAGGIQNLTEYDEMEDIQKFGEVSDAIACYFEGNSYDCTRAMMGWGDLATINSNMKWFDWRIPAQNNETGGIPLFRSFLWDGATGESAKIGSRVYDSLISEEEARRKLTESINKGTAIVNVNTHGNQAEWEFPKFDKSNISNLTNMSNLPLVISNACLTGGYNYSVNDENQSFLKPWFTNPNGGAYAVVASSVVLISPTPGWFNHGIYMSFIPGYREWFNHSTSPDFTSELPIPNIPKIAEGTATRLGEMLYYSQMYCDNMTPGGSDYFNINLYGDPEGNIQLHKPVAQNVTHDSRIFSGKKIVKINTNESGSEVTLYSSELGIHKKAITDDTGIASFEINPLLKGTINVTVIKSGKRPYEGTINVRKYGDINNDGRINSSDMTVLSRHMSGILTLTGDNAIAADVNGDGVINSTDDALLTRYILGMIDIFPVEKITK